MQDQPTAVRWPESVDTLTPDEVDELRRKALCSFTAQGERLGEAGGSIHYPPETRDLWLRIVETGEFLDRISWSPEGEDGA